MAKRFNKDAFIKDMLRKRYLIAQADGSVLRANCADRVTGEVDVPKGYRLVKQQIHKPTGRVYFNCSYRGFTKSVLTNRVIAWAFHPNPENLPQVNHLDGDKENNAKDNLEWSSGSDNEKHAHRTGLKTGRGSANSNAKLNVQAVMEIRGSDRSPLDLARKFGVSRSTILNIQARKTWRHV